MLFLFLRLSKELAWCLVTRVGGSVLLYTGLQGGGGRWPSTTICLRKYKESDGKQVVPSDAP